MLTTTTNIIPPQTEWRSRRLVPVPLRRARTRSSCSAPRASRAGSSASTSPGTTRCGCQTSTATAAALPCHTLFGAFRGPHLWTDSSLTAHRTEEGRAWGTWTRLVHAHRADKRVIGPTGQCLRRMSRAYEGQWPLNAGLEEGTPCHLLPTVSQQHHTGCKAAAGPSTSRAPRRTSDTPRHIAHCPVLRRSAAVVACDALCVLVFGLWDRAASGGPWPGATGRS